MRSKEIERLPIRSLDKQIPNGLGQKFDIEALQVERKGEGIMVKAHRHDYYHILFVTKGKGEHSIDFKNYKIEANSMFFVSPGQVHSMNIDKDVEGFVISFTSDFYLLNNSEQSLNDHPFFHSISNTPVVYLDSSYHQFQMMMNDMLQEYQEREIGAERVLRALLEVLLLRISRYYRQSDKQDVPKHLSFQVRKLEVLIDRHFREYKLLNDYADLMYISPKHLNSLCKKGLNKTVTNLLHERTLTEAKRMLLFTDNSITEIAFDLGFSDKSYFMRFFKKQTTQTADEFRQKNMVS